MDVRGLKFSASLAYYTIFSLAPLLVLTISLAAIFFGQEAAEGKVFEEINGLVGNNAVAQIETMLKNVKVQEDNTLAFLIGIGTPHWRDHGIFRHAAFHQPDMGNQAQTQARLG